MLERKNNGKELCVEAIKNDELFLSQILRGDLLSFLRTNFNLTLPNSIRKTELSELAKEKLTVDTLELFQNKLDYFGITAKVIKNVLNISDYMVKKYLNQGLLNIKYYYKYPGDTYSYLYIYNVFDVIELYNSGNVQEKKKIKVEIPEITDLNLAEALYLINKSAKKSRDTKQKNYLKRNHGTCHCAKTRMNNLYLLKDNVMKKMIKENKLKYHGVYRQKYVDFEGDNTYCYLRSYSIEGFYFHIPIQYYRDNEKIEGEIENLIGAEKTRKVSLNHNQAMALLKKYLEENEDKDETAA